MGGLSGRTKIQSRHVLRSQCWPDGCRTFAFCCTDRASLLSLRIFVHGHTNCQIEFSIAYRWNRITTRGKMDIHPPKNVRRGAPKGGIASTQGEACPRQSIHGEHVHATVAAGDHPSWSTLSNQKTRRRSLVKSRKIIKDL